MTYMSKIFLFCVTSSGRHSIDRYQKNHTQNPSSSYNQPSLHLLGQNNYLFPYEQTSTTKFTNINTINEQKKCFNEIIKYLHRADFSESLSFTKKQMSFFIFEVIKSKRIEFNTVNINTENGTNRTKDLKYLKEYLNLITREELESLDSFIDKIFVLYCNLYVHNCSTEFYNNIFQEGCNEQNIEKIQEMKEQIDFQFDTIRENIKALEDLLKGIRMIMEAQAHIAHRNSNNQNQQENNNNSNSNNNLYNQNQQENNNNSNSNNNLYNQNNNNQDFIIPETSFIDQVNQNNNNQNLNLYLNNDNFNQHLNNQNQQENNNNSNSNNNLYNQNQQENNNNSNLNNNLYNQNNNNQDFIILETSFIDQVNQNNNNQNLNLYLNNDNFNQHLNNQNQQENNNNSNPNNNLYNQNNNI